MHLILNGINGRYLREIPDNWRTQTESVEAAVAYATEDRLLFRWCLDHDIPLTFWGRFDETVPVRLDILRLFHSRRSPNFVCKLVTHFHAKVIWWHGVGAYVGSANFTDAAWNKNIEAGCFFDEAEMIASGMDLQLRSFFSFVDQKSSPLSDELLQALEIRARELTRQASQDKDQAQHFLATTGVKQWPGLVTVPAREARERQKRTFLDEWFDTLQILRNIAATVTKDENRPGWIPPTVPAGAQADQFLAAYYYSQVIGEDGRSYYARLHEQNVANVGRALSAAITWWRELPEAPPPNVGQVLVEWVPFLKEMLSEDRILGLTADDFNRVCHRVWSIQDHARRVSNATVGLPGGSPHDRDVKTTALAEFLFSRRSQNGSSVLEMLHYVLYGGPADQVPERLWEAISTDAWKIEHLGISALGELVGWAMPDLFPPRNNRTSKALYALGYNVSFVGN
ncbi:phospholipase D family protein [Bradyrhizobium oligotrophicum]|uniref:phospholipase D family protein n=1 Tax=Bradyrhizobium oligotrophicum TaxID=44255 RepID=UPI003EBF316C